MKFEHKYPSASQTDRFEFEYSYITKSPKLDKCRWCNSFTKWLDILFQVHTCSEECNAAMWKHYKEDQKANSTYDNFEKHFENVKSELKLAEVQSDCWKDIIIIVHNQLDYLKACIESLKKNTSKFHLYLWDNASSQATSEYIEKLIADYDSETEQDIWTITIMNSATNMGFILPNNELAAWGDSEYIILLNSDTKVFEYWDKAMIAFMEHNKDVGQVGYWGGHMGPDGRGFGGENGYDVDYIPGWCFCIRRSTYDQYGLFNKQLQFAYCEDADLSLRLKAAGYKIYALHAPLVHHYQNKTVIEVENEGKIDLRASFDHNHEYMKLQWKDYLANDRVLLKRKRELKPVTT